MLCKLRSRKAVKELLKTAPGVDLVDNVSEKAPELFELIIVLHTLHVLVILFIGSMASRVLENNLVKLYRVKWSWYVSRRSALMYEEGTGRERKDGARSVGGDQEHDAEDRENARASKVYPMPINASGKYNVEVGRIRQSLVFGSKGLGAHPQPSRTVTPPPCLVHPRNLAWIP